MASTVLGRVGMLPKGPWSETTAYEKLDVVSSDGNSFVALKPSTGIQPTNAEYWMALTENQPFIENANAAKESAQQAAASAQNAVNQANQAVTSANQAIQSANTAATNANNAAENANKTAAGLSGQITDLQGQINGKADAFQVGPGLQMDGDVLGVKPEGNYELIETITLEEDNIKSIVRDVSLYGIMVLAKFAKASKITHVFMEIICVEKMVTGSAFIRTDGEVSARFNAQKKSGYWDLCSQGYVKGGGSGNYYGQNNAANVLFVANNPIITSVRLYASDGIGVLTKGSVIEIWGVRADA